MRAAVDKLKNKAPGQDGISSEILREGYKYMENRIYELIVQIWNEERIPMSWIEALICPIHRKGDVQNCENFRGISLVNAAYMYCQSCYMETKATCKSNNRTISMWI